MAFKVIEGGGRRPPEDFDMRRAVQALRTLTIESLRALARGNDPRHRVTEALIELYKLLGEKGLKVDTVVESFLAAAHSELAAEGLNSEMDDILVAGLQVIAEKLCLDEAAEGRTSQRERRFEDRLEMWLCESEKRSRDNGWSYLEEFLQRNFPRPRPEKKGDQQAPKGSRKPDVDPQCAEAYERFMNHEVSWDQLPPGRYPNGMRVYAEGEWEAIVRASPMQKREIGALKAYFESKGTVGYVRGGGLAITERLAARGYVEVIQENREGRIPFYGITPAGEAAWLRLEKDR